MESRFSKLDAVILCVFGILSVASCTSEAMARNATRILICLAVVRCCLEPALLRRLLEIKLIICTMCIYFGVMFASAIYGGNFHEVIQDRSFILQYNAMLLPVSLLLMQKKEQIKYLIYGIFASLVVSDFYVFYERVQGDFRPGILLAPGFSVATGVYASVIPAIAVLFFDEKASLKRRILLAIACILSLAGLVATNTRGGWLAVFPLVIVIVMYHIPGWQKKLIVFMIIVFSCIGTAISIPSVQERVASIGRGTQEQSVSERFLMWQSAIEMGLDNPVLGIGKGNYTDKYYFEYISPFAKERDLGWAHSHCHNNFLMMFAEDGLLGLGSFCGMLMALFAWGWKHRTRIFGRVYMVSLLGYILYGLTDYNLVLYGPMRILWCILGLCIAYEYLSKVEMLENIQK